MKLENAFLNLTFRNASLTLTNSRLKKRVSLDFPAVKVVVGHRNVAPTISDILDARVENNELLFKFVCSGINFEIAYRLAERGSWLVKKVYVTGGANLPSPDYVQLDCQSGINDTLSVRGYRPSVYPRERLREEEEAGGFIAGCGYPAIGAEFFIGGAHPAAFCAVENNIATVSHYPVWENDALQVIDVVIGWGENAGDLFADYLDSIRLPRLKKPLIAFGTAWSDPGSLSDPGGLAVTFDDFKDFIKAFQRFGLKPDYFTQDCCWYNSSSLLAAKTDIHGDDGLRELRRVANETGAKISLWISHNGRIAFDPDFLRSNNFAVGSGRGAAYCGDRFAVMMDARFRQALKERLIALVQLGVSHFKIDFDNECATRSDFDDKYPTRNHVRQASINAFFEIADATRKANPDIITRNGWWPSPWWLTRANHLWLTNSGDTEYSSLSGDNQREASLTHRDTLYYAILQRDQSPVPLDCFDNHEFANAMANPFSDTKSSWANALWMVCARGNTYQPFSISPQSLTKWQIRFWRDIMTFCRAYHERLYVDRARMVGGCPGHGELYGFCHPGDGQTWLALRNPQAIPRRVHLDFSRYADGEVNDILMFYPHFERVSRESAITFLPHEVKIFIISARNFEWDLNLPAQVAVAKRKIYYPASAEVTGSEPVVAPSRRIGELVALEKESEVTGDAAEFRYFLRAPYRMRDFKLRAKFTGAKSEKIVASARYSRYKKAKDGCFQLPVTQIRSASIPGHGEERNPDLITREKATYFSIDIPCGGNFAIVIRFENMEMDPTRLSEFWLSGYEGRALTCVDDNIATKLFPKALPPQHPYGFGRALKLE